MHPTAEQESTLVVAVGSQNPVKRRAAVEAIQATLRPDEVAVTVVDVASGVAAQPIGDDETLRGARNRAEAAWRAAPTAHLSVGIEGGITERDGALEAFAWVVVLGSVPGTDSARRGESRTATFALPAEIADLVRGGMELGDATDQVFAKADTKHGSGTVGPLTGGLIDRGAYYAHAVALALVPFRNPGLTFTASAAEPVASVPAE